MIDDLITRGAPEPYRMFTSRAEYRLLLRADNADQRLTPAGISVGCVGSERTQAFTAKQQALADARAQVDQLTILPIELSRKGFKVNQDGIRRTALELLRYPEISMADLQNMWPELAGIPADILEQLEIDGRYAGYIQRQEADIAAFRRDEALQLPKDLDYTRVGSLSNEMQLKLGQHRPATLGAAARIPGVTPAALVALLRHVRRRDRDTTTDKPEQNVA